MTKTTTQSTGSCYLSGYRVRMGDGQITIAKKHRRQEILFSVAFEGEPSYEAATEAMSQYRATK